MSENKNLQLSEIQNLLLSITPEKLTDLALNDTIFDEISTLNEPLDLENVGKKISCRQFLEILSHEKIEQKIAPLLVGLKQEIFEEVLMRASDKQLNLLKVEGYSEAVTHHLFLFVHHLESDASKLFHILSAIEARIGAIDPEITTQEEAIGLRKTLDECSALLDLALKKIQRSLSIAWSGQNILLVELFNTLKSSLTRFQREVIGIQNHTPSGLYALLAKKLYAPTLKNDDPALEGLASFCVWYLEDYQDVGLLPKGLPTSLDQNEHSEEECYEYREKLFKMVEENLNKIGLHTVKDLKNEELFSRNTLKTYILTKQLDFS